MMKRILSVFGAVLVFASPLYAAEGNPVLSDVPPGLVLLQEKGDASSAVQGEGTSASSAAGQGAAAREKSENVMAVPEPVLKKPAAPVSGTASSAGEITDTLRVMETEASYVEGRQTEILLQVTGEVVNLSGAAVRDIVVEILLCGKDGQVLARHLQPAGVLLSETQLARLDVDRIVDLLSQASDAVVAPGGSLSFMTVFASVPEGVGRFQVHIYDAQRADAK